MSLLILVLYLVSAPLLPLLLSAGRNLEYEYAALTGLLYLISAFFLPLFKPIAEALLSAKAKYWLIGFVAIFIPATVLWATKQCLCSPYEGILWLGLQTSVCYLVAIATALGLCHLRISKLSLTSKSFLWFFIIGLMVVYPLLSLWFLPQKRILSLGLGFFHGPIYDAWIPIDLGIVWSRLLHSITALVGIYTFWKGREPVKVLTGATCLLSLLLVCQIPLPYASSGNGSRHLKEVLSQVRSDTGYHLYFTEALAKRYPKRLQIFEESLRFHINDLKSLGTLSKPVEVYVYDDRKQKKLLFGGDLTDITDVVTPSIHVLLESWPHSTLRHELIHALTSEKAYFGLGFHPNMTLTEGLATAFAPPVSDFSLDESAASLIEQKRLPEPENLFTPLFWLESGRVAYRTAGSFLDYLRRDYGDRALFDLYAGKSWQTVFSVPVSKNWMQWQNAIQKETPSDSDLYGEAVFRSPGLLRSLCPHSKASLQPSKQRINVVPRRPEWKWADYYRWRLSLNANDQRSKLALYRINLSKGADLEWPTEFSYLEDYEKFLTNVDQLMNTGQTEKAIARMSHLYLKSQEQFLGYSLHRQIDLRYFAIKQLLTEKHDWEQLFLYLQGKLSVNNLKLGNRWLNAYLKVRQPGFYSENLELEQLLEQAIPEEMSRNIRFEYFYSIARKAVAGRHFETATKALLEAEKHAHNGAKGALNIYLRQTSAFSANE